MKIELRIIIFIANYLRIRKIAICLHTRFYYVLLHFDNSFPRFNNFENYVVFGNCVCFLNNYCFYKFPILEGGWLL